MENILSIKGLCKNYQQFSLKNVGFQVPRGYIMGFIGENGAGKTTTIKSIVNMVNTSMGEIEIFRISKDHMTQRHWQDIGIVMDGPFYNGDWKVKQVETALKLYYENWNTDRFSAYLAQYGISKTKKVKELSKGMKVKLMLAAAFSHDAKLLILDEPTSGLDPVARAELLDCILEFISDESRGVIFSTHITADLEKIADYITFIKNGEVVFTGEKEAFMETYMIIKGGTEDLDKIDKSLLVGVRTHKQGFEAMIKSDSLYKVKDIVVCENASLEDIMIYYNREGNA